MKARQRVYFHLNSAPIENQLRYNLFLFFLSFFYSNRFLFHNVTGKYAPYFQIRGYETFLDKKKFVERNEQGKQ